MSAGPQDFSFKVLKVLSQERGVYGLRNGDNERYRRHCSNKLHRLRQVTGTTNGKGKVFKKAPAITEANVKDVKHLQLLLFSAERALAHSHALKAEAKSSNPNVNARREQLSWLRRALRPSAELYAIASSLADAGRLSQRCLAEITIYHLSLRAELSFEKSQWAESLTELSSRRKLLSTLSEAARDSYDQALANEFIDSYDPLIRFSAYKLGRSESHDIEGVVADIDEEMMDEALPGFSKLIEGLREETGVEEMEAGRKILEDVEFAGEKVELRSAEIVAVMLKVQDALGRLKGKVEGGRGGGMKGWDRVLGILGEAEGVAKRLLDDHEASGSSTSLRSTRTSQSLSLAHQYIVHLLLTHRIRRDLLLVDSLSTSSASLPSDPTDFRIKGGRAKVEEAVKAMAAVVKLYDTVLQSMSQLRGLAIVEEKEGVRRGAEGAEAYFHATKCYHLARLHCIHPSPSYSSAVQLLTRSNLLVRQAKSSLSESENPIQEQITPITDSTLENLSEKVQALDLAAKRALFAEKIPKPVFFDTAFNYIDLPIDELMVLAGTKGKDTKPPVVVAVESTVAEVVENVSTAAKKVAGWEKSREATPAPEGPSAEGTKPKGWLGGWFGKK